VVLMAACPCVPWQWQQQREYWCFDVSEEGWDQRLLSLNRFPTPDLFRAAPKGDRAQRPAPAQPHQHEGATGGTGPQQRPRGDGKVSQGQDTKAEREVAAASEGSSGSGSEGAAAVGGDGENEGLDPAVPLGDLASGVDFGEDVDKPPEVRISIHIFLGGGSIAGGEHQMRFGPLDSHFASSSSIMLNTHEHRNWTSGSAWP
jgi:hypothetical protein